MNDPVAEIVTEHLAADAVDLARERDVWREIALAGLGLLHAAHVENDRLKRRLIEAHEARRADRRAAA